MKLIVRCMAVLLALGGASTSGWAQSHAAKVEHKAKVQYEKEHKARVHRHRTHNRAERARAKHAYALEHKARLHRHHAVEAAKRHEHHSQ